MQEQITLGTDAPAPAPATQEPPAESNLRQRVQQRTRQIAKARQESDGQNGGRASSALVKSVYGLLEELKPELQRALPRQLSADRLVRVALTTIRMQPKLMQCSKASLAAALLQCAQLGLEPGPLGHVWLVPFWNKVTGSHEVTFIIGYRGMIELAYRSERIATIYAQCVYERDEFDLEYGLNPQLHHKPVMRGDRGDIVGAYLIAHLSNGASMFHFMPRSDIDRHRAFSKAANDGPWVTHFPEMAMKTVVRDSFRFLPVSIEAQRAVAMDEATATADGKLVSAWGDAVIDPTDETVVIDADGAPVDDAGAGNEAEPQPVAVGGDGA